MNLVNTEEVYQVGNASLKRISALVEALESQDFFIESKGNGKTSLINGKERAITDNLLGQSISVGCLKCDFYPDTALSKVSIRAYSVDSISRRLAEFARNYDPEKVTA